MREDMYKVIVERPRRGKDGVRSPPGSVTISMDPHASACERAMAIVASTRT
jgi:hypothetical protein